MNAPSAAHCGNPQCTTCNDEEKSLNRVQQNVEAKMRSVRQATAGEVNEALDVLSDPSLELKDDGTGVMRKFNTGATRHTDEGKLDYEGFLSPLVLRRFAEYMHKNRVQADGELRASDNWQRGIPPEAYMKSLLRHVMDVWLGHRRCIARPEIATTQAETEAFKEALCGVLFNAMGYLHELLKEQ